MNRKRKVAKIYRYMLPKDADTIRVEALGMGALVALRAYPTLKTRETLETEARVGLATLRSHHPSHYCTDFEAMSRIYIPYYIGGFEDAHMRYRTIEGRYESDTAVLAEYGPIVALKTSETNYAEHLESIKAEMDTTTEWHLPA